MIRKQPFGWGVQGGIERRGAHFKAKGYGTESPATECVKGEGSQPRLWDSSATRKSRFRGETAQ